MKIFLNVFVVIIFISFFQGERLYSNWTHHGLYKELDLSDTSIVSFKASKFDDYFYSLDSRLIYRKFDYYGNCVSSMEIGTALFDFGPGKELTDWHFSRISSDGLSLLYIHNEINYDYRKSVYFFRIYNLNYEIIREDKDSIDLLILRHFDYLEYFDYDQKSDKLIYYLNNSQSSTSPMFIEDLESGFGCLAISDSSKKNIGVAHLKNIDHNENFDRIILSGYYRWERLWETSDWFYENKSFLGYDNFTKGIKSGFYVDYGADEYKMRKDKQIYKLSNYDDNFLSYQDSVLRFFEIVKDSIKNNQTKIFNFKINDIAYSLIDKYLVVIDKNYNIIIYDISTGLNLQTFTAPDTSAIFDLKVTKKGNGFFVRTNKTLRLYNSVYLTEIGTQFDTGSKFSISSNPVTDFLKINSDQETGKIEIFTILGLKIWQSSDDFKPSDDYTRIDVTGLAPGVYFVKVGNQVRKFIKI